MTIQDKIKSVSLLLESLLGAQEIHIDQVILLKTTSEELIDSIYDQIGSDEWPLNHEVDFDEPDDPNDYLDTDYSKIIEPPEPDISDRSFFDLP